MCEMLRCIGDKQMDEHRRSGPNDDGIPVAGNYKAFRLWQHIDGKPPSQSESGTATKLNRHCPAESQFNVVNWVWVGNQDRNEDPRHCQYHVVPPYGA